jgi:hypothetical protein
MLAQSQDSVPPAPALMLKMQWLRSVLATQKDAQLHLLQFAGETS